MLESSGAQEPAAGQGSAAAQAAERRAAGVAGGEPDAGPATKQSAQEIAEVVQHAVADTGVPVVSAPPAASSGQQSSSDTAKVRCSCCLHVWMCWYCFSHSLFAI